MDSLDWNKLTKKPEAPDPRILSAVFRGFKVPSTKKGGKK